jgi:protein gp37
MGEKTAIEWCDSTANISSGCDGCELWNGRVRTCYAGNLHEGRMAKALPTLYAPNFSEVREIPGRLWKAARWRDLRGTERQDKPWLNGLPRCIFVGDMGDFLSAGLSDEYLERELLAPIRSPEGKRHLWMLLTKRPRRLARLSEKWGGLPDNCIAMTTATDQPTADIRVAEILKVRCRYRGLSLEPLLGPVDLSAIKTAGDTTANALAGTYSVEYPPCPRQTHGGGIQYADGGPSIHWVIVGAESGPKRRAMDPAWALSIRRQCQSAGVPFFCKQMEVDGAIVHDIDRFPAELRVREFPALEVQA